MPYMGTLKVLSALKAGEPVTCIVNGGGPACVNSLGALAAIAEHALPHFKSALCGSGGALNFAGFLSAPEEIGAIIGVYRYIALRGHLRFIYDLMPRLALDESYWKAKFEMPKSLLRLSFDREELMNILEGKSPELGFPALDAAKVKRHETEFNVAVTMHRTGEGRIINAREDLFTALRATISIPGVCVPVSINGEHVSDGAVGMGSVLMRMRAKYILIIMNQLPPSESGWWGKWWDPMLAAAMEVQLSEEPEDLRKSVQLMEVNFESAVKRIMNSDSVEALLIYPNQFEAAVPWTLHPLFLTLAYNATKRNMEKLLAKAHAL